MIMLIHPETGDVQLITQDDAEPRRTFEWLVKDGYRPIGPRARAAAEAIKREAKP
jgi:hypothetical protein